MADRKKGSIIPISEFSEKKLHTPEYSAETDADVHGTIPEKVPMAETIKKYRKKAKLSQQAIADHLGVTRNTVVNWEAGKYRPDADLFPSLCNLLGITLNDLFGIEPGPADSFSAHERSMIMNYRLISPVSRRIVDRMIDSILEEESSERGRILKESTELLGEVETAAAAGDGYEFSDVPMETCHFVFRSDRNKNADAIIKVKGESMLPVYRDQDRVYVQFTPSAGIGEDVICSSRQGMHIKRLGEDGPYSVNPKEPFTLISEDDNVRIIGRVLGIVDPKTDYPSAAENELLLELRKEDVLEYKAEHGME